MMSGATQDCIPSRGNGEVSVIKPEPLVNVPDSNESSPGSSSHNMLVATNYQMQVPATSSNSSSNNGSTGIGNSVMATVNNSAGGISTTGSSNTANYHHFIGRLISKDHTLLIGDDVIEVGRNSSTSLVDFHVGENSFVSRNHFTIKHDMNDEFTLFCLSKNGIFIDNVLHRKSGGPYKLPTLCSIRFPSTGIIIEFENLIELAKNGIMIDLNDHTPVKITGCPMSIPLQNITSNSVGSGGSSTSTGGALCVSGNKSPSCSVIYAPLKISIPSEQGASGGTGQGLLNNIPRGRCRGSLVGGVSGGSGGRGSDIHGGGGGSVGSGYPSPKGTISVANSCPTSPRQNVHDVQNVHHDHSYISHSTNNNNNSECQAPAAQSLETDRPQYTFPQLIVQAISASPENQLTVAGIYSFISKNYPYYRTCATKGWQNTIRHNLSFKRHFIKLKKSDHPRPQDETDKGSIWQIDPSSKEKLIEQSYQKRAANSCPTSPRQNVHDVQNVHHDHSYISHSTNNNNNSECQAPAEMDKPPYTFPQLIVQAISASPENQLTVAGIYSFISKNYPYYRTCATKGWQNSIRHALSFKRHFIKQEKSDHPRPRDETDRGSFWQIDPSSKEKLIEQSYQKRGSQQSSYQVSDEDEQMEYESDD